MNIFRTRASTCALTGGRIDSTDGAMQAGDEQAGHPRCARLPAFLLGALVLCTAHLAGVMPARAVTFTSNTLILAGDTMYEGNDIVVSNCTLTIDGAHAFNSLTVLGGSGVVTHSAVGSSVNLTIATFLTVGLGAGIDVSGRGYPSGQGPGAGTSTWNLGGAAGSGGVGGSWGGIAGGGVYGSIIEPSSPGSGGGGSGYWGSAGGAGGGVVRLVVGGTLTVDGTLSANGADAPHYTSGGGSGGSIWVNAGTLAGTGAINAKGGASSANTGGGGGGRIGLYYDASSFTGSISAPGGAANASAPGGAGTIFTKPNSENNGQVLIDNAGQTGGWTRLDQSQWPHHVVFRLRIANRPNVKLAPAMTIHSVQVAADSSPLPCS